MKKTILFIGPVDYAKNGINSVNEMTNMNLGILDELENFCIQNQIKKICDGDCCIR